MRHKCFIDEGEEGNIMGLNIEIESISLAADEEIIKESGYRDLDIYDGDMVVIPKQIGVTGSAVLNDMKAVELFYGKSFIGNYNVTTVGVKMPLRDDMKSILGNRAVKLEDLKLFCREAPITNQLYIRINCR
ncbi:hypothetical protein ES705_38168 [subsurface metagenome]